MTEPLIALKLRGDNAWPDIADRGRFEALPVWGLAALAKGMSDGTTSLMLRLDLPDGNVVTAQTSLAAFLQTADTLRDAFPDG